MRVSDSNFFLAEMDHAYEVYKTMADDGVVVRYRGKELHCKDCLRITVGTPEENKVLLKKLQETCKLLVAQHDGTTESHSKRRKTDE